MKLQERHEGIFDFLKKKSLPKEKYSTRRNNARGTRIYKETLCE